MTHLENFTTELPNTLPGEQHNWLTQTRAAGVARFNELGIPSTKDEDWKYTNLRALASKPFNATQREEGLSTINSSELDATRLVFSNGLFQSSLSDLTSLPAGAIVCSMAKALHIHADKVQAQLAVLQPEDGNVFISLNTGLFTDGTFVFVPKGVKLEKPVEMTFVATGEQTFNTPRNLIIFEEGAEATIIERHLSSDESTALTNTATEIKLSANAQCDFYLIQTAGAKARQIGGTWVHQEAGSRFSARTITLGGQLVRNELKVTLAGENAHTDCIGLFIGKARQHIDNHTTIRHQAPNCTSREVYKGILDDRARGVFHGRVVVDQDAQQTFAEQENANLLLSRDAEVDTKPQLEIYADDVKCSHGATVGELDAKQIFYLQSRGIDKDSARTLLTYAFAADVLDEIELPSLKNELRQVVAKNMHLEGIS
ncbi:MAG: Fe-S cluster assembly protein SufD [Cryomorphaceae bacterium]|jgi:Fe-S cluster assembly protein SufD